MTTTDLDDLDEALSRYRPDRPAVVDPDEVAAIAARVAYGQLPWWQRLRTPTPPGWRDQATGHIH